MKDTHFNVLTVFFLLLTLVFIVTFVMIFLEPNSGINPFPPPTLPPRLELPTATPTLIQLPPTWTPAPSPTPGG